MSETDDRVVQRETAPLLGEKRRINSKAAVSNGSSGFGSYIWLLFIIILVSYFFAFSNRFFSSGGTEVVGPTDFHQDQVLPDL